LLTYAKAFSITSKNPFTLLEEVKRKIVDEQHRPMTESRPDLNPELVAIVDRALAKDPDDRFRDLAEMRRKLRGVRERLEDAAAETGGRTTIILSPALAVALGAGRQALDADDPTEAIRQIEAVLANATSGVVRRELEQTLEDARERQMAKRAELRAAQQRAAEDAAGKARRAFIDGRHREAIDDLARFEPQELVSGAVAELGRALAAIVRAREDVDSADPAARAHAADALAEFPQQDLVAREWAALGARAEQREAAERSAVAAVASARELFAASHRDEAVAALRSHPDQPRVSTALAAMVTAAAQVAKASDLVETADEATRVRALADLERSADPALVANALQVLRARHDDRTAEEARAEEARQQREAHTRAAESAAERARVQFVAGEEEAALRTLEEFSPPHPLVTEALEELRVEAVRSAELRAELEREARVEVATAEAEFAAGEFDAAVERLGAFRDPSTVGDAIERLRRARVMVARSMRRVRSGDRRQRAAALRELQQFDPQGLMAAAVRQAEAIEAERRAAEELEAARAAVGAAVAQFDGGDRADALASLGAFSPPHPLVQSELARLTALAAERETQEQRERDQRAADEATSEARARFAAGHVADALAALESFSPGPLVAESLRQLRRVSQVIDKASTTVANGAPPDRAAAIERLRDAGPEELLAGAVAALAARDRERTDGEKRDQEERERTRLEASAASARASARARFVEGSREEARRSLEDFESPALVADVLAEYQLLDEALTTAERELADGDRSARARAIHRVEQLEPADLVARSLEALRERDAAATARETAEAELQRATAAVRERDQRWREGRAAVEAAIARREEAGARSALDGLRRDGMPEAGLQDIARRLESLARELAQERDLAKRIETASLAAADALSARNSAVARASIATLQSLGADAALLRGLGERVDELETDLAVEAEAIRWRAEQLAVVERALEHRRADEATAALKGLRERGASGPDIDACAARAVALQREIAEAREREARLDATLAEVTDAVEREDLSAARRLLRTLESAGAADPKVEAARARTAALAAAIELQKRRAAELRRGLDAVEQALAARQPDAARRALTTLHQAGFGAAELGGADQRLAVLDEALRQAKAEAARAKEQERDRARAAAELAAVQARDADASRKRDAKARRLQEDAEREVQRQRDASLRDEQAREVADRRDRAETAQDLSVPLLAREPGDAAVATLPAAIHPAAPCGVPSQQRRAPMAIGALVGALLIVIAAGWGVMRWAWPPASAPGNGPSTESAPDSGAATTPAPGRVAGGKDADVNAAREAAVNETLAAARRNAEAGQMDVAIAQLQRFAPADSRVDELRSSLEALRTQNRALADEQAFVARLDAALRRRDFTTASSVAAEALKKFPSAPAIDNGVRRLARAAQQETRDARDAVKPQQRTAVYNDGVRSESRARQLLASAPLEAFRQYRSATEAFARAAKEPAMQTGNTVATGTGGPPPPAGSGPDVPEPVDPKVITQPPLVGKGSDPLPPTLPGGATGAEQPAGSDTVTAGAGGGASRSDTAGGLAYTAEVAKREILELVRAFEAAYTAMDENRLRQLQPGFPGIPRKDLIKSVRLAISDVQIRLADDLTSANVVGTYNYQYDWRRSGFPPTSPAPLNWTVVKTDRGWRVR
jgi:hypothetical protein